MINPGELGNPEVERYLEERRLLTDRLKSGLIETLQLPLEEAKIDLDCPLFGSGLGLDSVDAVGLAALIETDFNIHVQDSDISMFRSINTVADYILRKRAGTAGQDDAPEMPLSTREAKNLDVEPASGDEGDGIRDYITLRKHVGIVEFPSPAVILVEGPDAESCVDFLVAGNVADLPVGCLLHTVILDEDGAISAIVWVARQENGYRLITSEDKRRELLAGLDRCRDLKQVEVTDRSETEAVLAVIGPKAQEMVVDVVGDDLLRLAYGEFEDSEWHGVDTFIGRFGETGEFDYRFIVPRGAAAAVKAELLDSGSIYRIRSCPPRALLTLMMEMKSIYQGSMLIPGCSPQQVDLLWMVDFRKEDFVGRKGLLESLDQRRRRSLLLTAENQEGPRDGGVVLMEDVEVGFVQAEATSWVLSSNVLFAYVEDPVAVPNLRFQIRRKGTNDTLAISRSAPLFLTETVLSSFNL